MFGTNTPWLTVLKLILQSQWPEGRPHIYYLWQRTQGIIDMWQEGNIEIITESGDWQVTSQQL